MWKVFCVHWFHLNLISTLSINFCFARHPYLNNSAHLWETITIVGAGHILMKCSSQKSYFFTHSFDNWIISNFSFQWNFCMQLISVCTHYSCKWVLLLSMIWNLPITFWQMIFLFRLLEFCFTTEDKEECLVLSEWIISYMWDFVLCQLMLKPKNWGFFYQYKAYLQHFLGPWSHAYLSQG